MAREYGNHGNAPQSHVATHANSTRKIAPGKPRRARDCLILPRTLTRTKLLFRSFGGCFTMAHASALRTTRPFAAIAAAALCLMLAGCGVNNIPTYEQNAKAKWSEVLNQYKRRVRPHSQPGRDRQRLRRPGEERADRRHRGAGQGQPGADQHPGGHPDQPGGDEALPGRAELAGRRARPADGGGRSAIPTSSRGRTSWPCSRSSKAPRTASPSRGATTSRRCASITPRSRPSRAASGARSCTPPSQADGDLRHPRGRDADPQGRLRHQEVAPLPRGDERCLRRGALRL